MNLTHIFNEGIKPAETLLCLYEELVTSNERAIRPEWENRFLATKLTSWPKTTNLWRSYSKDKNILIVGTCSSRLTHKSFEQDTMTLFLHSAIVAAVAAVDKILHEALSLHFVKLAKTGKLDTLAQLPPSKVYEIATRARTRKGKGGKTKSRSGDSIKEGVIEQIYKDTYLDSRHIEKICDSFGQTNVFYKSGQTFPEKFTAKQMKTKWGRIYHIRNIIAHECGMERKLRTKKITYISLTHKQASDAIAFCKKFGSFLATALQSGPSS